MNAPISAPSGRLVTLLTADQIQDRVRSLADEIAQHSSREGLVCVGVLTGAVVFLADLIRSMPAGLRPRLDMIRVSSYGEARKSSGNVRLLHDIVGPISGRDVLIVEDIVDTGMTARFLVDHLSSYGPSSLRMCTLLDKPSRRLVAYTPDYVGFTIPDHYVVGYGLDDNGWFRELPEICVLAAGSE